MILELDCGNSLIKWRIIDTQPSILARGAASSAQQLFTDISNTNFSIDSCRLVSVRSEEETELLISKLEHHYTLPIQQALTCAEFAGVKNGYHDYTKLGADRWLAMLAAYSQKQRATVVLGFGTAITSDFINSEGQHLGGFIAPGLLLMRQQLLSNTSRIHYHKSMTEEILSPVTTPAVTTEKAVNGGCNLMLQGFISMQQQLAKDYFGKAFDIYTTGGDAAHFNIPNANHTPDLVFSGLALACPITES